MKQPDTMTVRILDKEYCVTCPIEKRASLKAAAAHLDKIMREIRSSGKAIGTERIAVTAALNITYELLEEKVQAATQQPTTDTDTKQMDAFNQLDTEQQK